MTIHFVTLAVIAMAGLSHSLQAQTPVTFSATDGKTVYAHWYRVGEQPPSLLILAFHQGGASGAAEYGPIVGRLNAAGYDLLAVDQRAGGNLFGGTNRTAAGYGESPEFCDAAPDVTGALEYARREAPDVPVLLWGSSYSGALALRLAAGQPDGVVGVLVFSPASGDPMAGCRGETVSDRIQVPVLALRPRSELEREAAALQFQTFESQGHATFVADPGTHGSSMLVAERVDGSVEASWVRVEEFIRLVLAR